VKVHQKKIVNVENKTIDDEGSNNYRESSSYTSDTDLDSKSTKLKKNQDLALEHSAPIKQVQRSESTTTDVKPKVSEEAVNEALEAEEHARKAKILSITSVVTLVAGSFFLGIGFFVSIVLAIIARTQYLKSSGSRFNTSTGQYDEELARKWLIAYWIILGVLALLTIALILALILL
jgi:hypothetical protein